MLRKILKKRRDGIRQHYYVTKNYGSKTDLSKIIPWSTAKDMSLDELRAVRGLPARQPAGPKPKEINPFEKQTQERQQMLMNLDKLGNILSISQQQLRALATEINNLNAKYTTTNKPEKIEKLIRDKLGKYQEINESISQTNQEYKKLLRERDRIDTRNKLLNLP